MTSCRRRVPSIGRQAATRNGRWVLVAEIAEGRRNVLDEADVLPPIDLYESHIAGEEAELLPMAARLLDHAALEEIGRAMRLRRGIDAVD